MIWPLVSLSFCLLNCRHTIVGSPLLMTEFTQVETCDIVDCRSESFRYKEMAKLMISYCSLTETEGPLPRREAEGSHACKHSQVGAHMPGLLTNEIR